MKMRIEFHPTWIWGWEKRRGTEYWETPYDWVLRIGPIWIMWGDFLWRHDYQEGGRDDE